MIKRFFTLVFLVAVGVVFFKNVDISTSWQKAQAFVEDNLGEGILEEIKIDKLEGKEAGLEKKLKKLTQDLIIKAEEGTDKYKEIETAVLETKNALEQTKAALQNLQSSAERSAGVLGIVETAEYSTPSTPTAGTTHNYYETIIKTIPSEEIEMFCEQWAPK